MPENLNSEYEPDYDSGELSSEQKVFELEEQKDWPSYIQKETIF